MAKPRLTLYEQERILEETERLLKEPISWRTGTWKCPLFEVDKNGRVVLDDDGNAKRACDMNNRPLSQYCIEGGLNQATYNILGEERARRLGAVNGENPESNDYAFDSSGYDCDPAELLGINKLAMELHSERIHRRLQESGDIESPEDYDGADAALILNDSFATQEEQLEGHRVITGLVRTRLEQVREELDAREGGTHAKKALARV